MRYTLTCSPNQPTTSEETTKSDTIAFSVSCPGSKPHSVNPPTSRKARQTAARRASTSFKIVVYQDNSQQHSRSAQAVTDNILQGRLGAVSAYGSCTSHSRYFPGAACEELLYARQHSTLLHPCRPHSRCARHGVPSCSICSCNQARSRRQVHPSASSSYTPTMHLKSDKTFVASLVTLVTHSA